jgi:hypothetical protein
MSTDASDLVLHDAEGECLVAPLTGDGLVSAYQIELLPTCPDPATITLHVDLVGPRGFEVALDYDLDVGAWVDQVETDRGWIFGAVDDDASTGHWIRAEPIGTTYSGQQCQPETDHTPNPGEICFVTGNGSVGGAAGENDVDGGKTTLLTPVFDLSDAVSADITYWRWYTNDLGNNPGEDYWRVDVTADGQNWTSLENTLQSANSWNEFSFSLLDYVPLTEQVQIRFIATDDSPGSLVEAGVDDFMLSAARTPVTDASGGSLQLPSGLVSCHPNPFNPKMAVTYRVGSESRVELCVYDVQGREVRRLVDRSVAPGEHTVLFDGRDLHGNPLPSGIYFVRLDTENLLQVRQITLLK